MNRVKFAVPCRQCRSDRFPVNEVPVRVPSSRPASALSCSVFAAIFVLAGPASAAGSCKQTPRAAEDGAPGGPLIAGAAFFTASQATRSAATIGEIDIVNQNVFDLEDPEENRALYRLANTLHIRTRPDVIESQLLFKSGDEYSQRLLDESERILRDNRYLRDAEISLQPGRQDAVDVVVCTTDVWTLNPSVSFGRGGGKNSGGIGLKEYNLLGSGTQIGVAFKSTVDRDSTALNFTDRNLLGSRYQLSGTYADNSDGYAHQLDFSRPFYALDTRHAGGLAYSSERSIQSLYDHGEIAGQYELSTKHHEAFIGFSPGLQGNYVRRFTAGIVYESREFSSPDNDAFAFGPLPSPREFTYPFVGIEIREDAYVEATNLDQIAQVEDRYLGRLFALRLGYSSDRFGSTASAWHYSGEFSSAPLVSERSTLLLGAEFGGRIEAGQSRNAQLSTTARYDLRQSEKYLLHVGVTGTVGHVLDLDNPVYLGGDNGLRGYPLRYQLGDRSALLTIEQRVFTEWYPFRLFHIGGAVFFDAGRTWGTVPGPVSDANDGWLRDAGFGLRIGNSRSGTGRMIHVDLAYPLDARGDVSSVQLLVEAKNGF